MDQLPAEPNPAIPVQSPSAPIAALPVEPLDWDFLLGRIAGQTCTPFIGAGADTGVLPMGSAIAREWAKTHRFPLADASSDLLRVSQFMALENDAMFPKDELAKRLAQSPAPDFSNPDQPHSVLASLPLPVYITTNYDDFMYQALNRHRPKKAPRRMLCRWNSYLANGIPAGAEQDFEWKRSAKADPSNPIVFHLHGHQTVVSSMVLTEDDYLDFLVNLQKEPDDLLPPRIKQAVTGTSLLFIGYSLNDWDFKVLFRSLMTGMEGSLRRRSVAVQLPPFSAPMPVDLQQEIRTYFNKYFARMSVQVYWGDALEFARELRMRWEQFPGGA